MAEKRLERQWTGLETAVIGMTGRFPGAKNIHEFWNNIKKGVESIAFFANEELKELGVDPELLKDPGYVKAKGVLENQEYFDASFFGYNSNEAEIMDPQIRIFHECCWEALENSNYSSDSYKGLIGLYAGCSTNFYWESSVHSPGKSSELDRFASGLLINREFLVTRISYNLGLEGPAYFVQTACSTSLVAIHAACRALITGECKIALAGGISIDFTIGYPYQEGMIASRDGHCRAFDARASGTVAGNGVGVVVLKTLKNALADRDYIYAVIKSSAINNDGDRKVGFTAPSIKGQTEVIRAAQRYARVESESIGYIETHGTGTALGDLVEIGALKKAFNSDKKGFCAIGSIKTNIGHLDAAAGVASFIKAVLALKHQLIPPGLHFESPNPEIDLENSPFYVCKKLSPWKNDRSPLRAGVSSFGMGGTNAHVILEEAPQPVIDHSSSLNVKSREFQLIVLSAKTAPTLDKMTENLAAYLQEHPDINLADAAYTLQVGRKAFNHRRMLVCSQVNEAIKSLSNREPGEVHSHQLDEEEGDKHVVFMFSGQGSQYVNMGLELYQTETLYREEMDRCFEILKSLTGYDIKGIIYPSLVSNRSNKSYMSDINQTEIAQPLLFAFEYALAKLLIKWGIKPYAMIGHSIGEYVAACLSGLFTLEDALALVVCRGQLMQQQPAGSMLSVVLPQAKLEPLLKLHDKLSLAAVNSSSLCVVSGADEAINRFAEILKKKRVSITFLHTSHAFHSSMMEPILASFEEKVSSIILNKPSIPYISNLTGDWIRTEDAMDPRYWVRHVRGTIRFADGLSQLLKDSDSIFVEIGPGQALSTFVRKHAEKKPGHQVINTVRHPKETTSDAYYLLNKIGVLWLSGITIDWLTYYAHECRFRLPLPTYPLNQRYYWKYRGGSKIEESTGTLIEDWFYMPSWEESPLDKKAEPLEIPGGCKLVFSDTCGLGEALIKKMKKAGQKVIVVRPGPGFSRRRADEYTINLYGNTEEKNDYNALIRELKSQDLFPRQMIHLWSITPEGSVEQEEWGNPQHFDRILEPGFYSLICLAKALGKNSVTEDVEIRVVTNHMQAINEDEKIITLKATLTGVCKVIPQEYPNIHCQSIDVNLPLQGSFHDEELIDLLLAEFSGSFRMKSSNSAPVAAYRGKRRMVQTFKPLHLRPYKEKKTPERLRERGVYLITGGLGGIGLTLAEYLAVAVKARLILTGRSFFPAPNEWDQWLTNHNQEDEISGKIRKLKEFEMQGAEVMIIRADAAVYQQMQALVHQAVRRFGEINGVIHTAGIPDGGVIQAKTREAIENVFAPKVKGTLALDNLLRSMRQEGDLDFFILCSSLASVLGAFGQVAYVSANAFLDAFARSSTTSGFTVSINWDTWLEVGMAVKAVKKYSQMEALATSRSCDAAHPLFSHWVGDSHREITYISSFNTSQLWVLGEHRIMGKAVLPGTAYLEMVRAAIEEQTGCSMVEIPEIFFLEPLAVEEDEEKEIRTVMKKQGNGFEFSIVGISTLTRDQWVQHSKGRVIPVESREEKKHDLQKIAAQCSQQEIVISEKKYKSQTGLMTFGPRWSVLKRIKMGKNQEMAMAFLELDEKFSGDLLSYKLHPAILDIAAGFLYDTICKEGNYLPFAYRGIKIKAALPRKLVSEVRLVKHQQDQKEMLVFNITIMDETGLECVYIEEYVLKKVELENETQNRCLEITLPGNLDTLEFKPSKRVKPGPGQVEIEVYATGLNFKEVLIALGMLPVLPNQRLAFGLECAGSISTLGEGVKEFAPGDEVIASGTSCFSRYITAPAASVVRKPAHLNFEEAATIPSAFMTAWYSLITLGRLSKGEKVLIHSAAGGVGLAAVTIARWVGAEIFATAGSPGKREFLSSLGIKHVMNSRSLDFVEEVKKSTGGEGVDVVLNSLPGEYLHKGLSIVAPYGRFLEIGVRDIINNTQLGMRAFEKSISFFVISVGENMPGFSSIFREIVQHIENRDFDILPHRVFPIGDIKEAFKYMSRANHIGKIVVSHEKSPEIRTGDAQELSPSEGITPVKGIEVFSRILEIPRSSGGLLLPQVLVSTTDFTAKLEASYNTGLVGSQVRLKDGKPPGTKHPRPHMSTDYTPPANKNEKMIAEIWQEFLGLEKVGIHDNFFELGASSLDIIQVNNKLNALLGEELSVVNFYTYPTVHSLVDFLEGKSSTEEVSSKEEESSIESQYVKSKKTFKDTIKKMKRL
jgi:acyl transferase domain-containing protein/NADPH:quinone reductase-like Zn-dependent oxidoreductase/acyl carrier protein